MIKRILLLFFLYSLCFSDSTLVDFNDFTVTDSLSNPRSAPNWLYTTGDSNTVPATYMSTNDMAGWVSTRTYSSTVNDYFYSYLNGYNSEHMGFSTYGFLDITSNGVVGNALRYYITGGKNTVSMPNGCGNYITTKQHYLDSLANEADPVCSTDTIGHPYLYVTNSSNISTPVPFDKTTGNNRLSLYIYIPKGLKNGDGGYGNPVQATVNVGPYTESQGHWYHAFNLQGGGWGHYVLEGHPQHNNSYNSSDDFPAPSNAIRDMGDAYVQAMFRFYITFLPYEGILKSPYEIKYDEFSFYNDTVQQNNETVASAAIMYNPEDTIFEVSFMDKYINNAHSYSTYQLRYSSSPINNANWSSATSAHILPDSRFGIADSTNGKFKKWWPYYQQVWAKFRLATDNEMNNLTSGQKIYFAIKDVSQVDGDSKTPVSATGGRDYTTYASSFDYAYDSAALSKVHLIDYIIAGADATPIIGSLSFFTLDTSRSYTTVIDTLIDSTKSDSTIHIDTNTTAGGTSEANTAYITMGLPYTLNPSANTAYITMGLPVNPLYGDPDTTYDTTWTYTYDYDSTIVTDTTDSTVTIATDTTNTFHPGDTINLHWDETNVSDDVIVSVRLNTNWIPIDTISAGVETFTYIFPDSSADSGRFKVVSGSAVDSSYWFVLINLDIPPEIIVQPVSDTTTGSASFNITAAGDNLHYAWYRQGIYTGVSTTTYSFTITTTNHNDSVQCVVWNNADTLGSNVVRLYVVYAIFDSVNTGDSNTIYVHGNFLSGTGWTATLSDSTLTTESGSATTQVFGYNHKITLSTRRYELVITDGTYTVSLWIGRRKSTGNNKPRISLDIGL